MPPNITCSHSGRIASALRALRSGGGDHELKICLISSTVLMDATSVHHADKHFV